MTEVQRPVDDIDPDESFPAFIPDQAFAHDIACIEDQPIPGTVQRVGDGCIYAGATSRPMAHRKAAISRAIAATTTGSFLPAALRRR